MKRILAVASLACLVASPAVGVGSESSLDVEWVGQESSIPNGSPSSARVTWTLNDAHGIVDDRSESTLALTASAENAIITGVPRECGEGSVVSDGVLTCHLDLVDDDGLAGAMTVPLHAWGADGSDAKVAVSTDRGLSAETDLLPIVAESGFDVALNTVGVTPVQVPFRQGSNATTLIPIQVGVPYGYGAIDGVAELTARISTNAGPNVGQNASISVVPIPHTSAIIGIASTTTQYPVADVDLSHTGDLVTMRVPLGGGSPRLTDPAGNLLDVVPVAGFALAVTYPVSDGTNTSSAWTVDLVSASVSGSVNLSEQVRTTNDSTAVTFVSTDGASAKWVNGTGNAAGGILADPATGLEPRAQSHKDVWDPSLGTGVLVGGANAWSGRGAVLPGDQGMGIVQNTAYIGGFHASTETHGMCLAFDNAATYTGGMTVLGLSDYSVEYLTGDLPGGFLNLNCGGGTWTADEPNEVRAIRILFTPANQEATSSRAILGAGYLVNENVAEGSHVWMTGGVSANVTESWSNPSDVGVIADLGEIDTTSFRDALEVVSSRTSVMLEVDEETIAQGATSTWTATTMVSEAPFNDRSTYNVTHRVQLPVGLTYVEGSASLDVTLEETETGQVLSWTAPVDAGAPAPVTFDTVHAQGTGRHNVTISVENTDAEALATDHADSAVVTPAGAAASIYKSVEAAEFAAGGSNRWYIDLANESATDLDLVDTIDILPYDGDGRGTSLGGTVAVTDVAAPERASVFVTEVDPASIDPDPNAESNGGSGTPSDMWSPWAGQENVTAVRWIVPDLASGTSEQFAIDFHAEAGGGTHELVNSVQARSGGAMTLINSMSSTVIGQPSKLQVDKAVTGQDLSLAEGSEIIFDVTVRNEGPGEAQHVTVTDHPEGLSEVTFLEVPRGTVSEDGLTWSIGSLEASEVVTAQVRGVATGGPASNQVVVDECEDCTVPPPSECVPNVDVVSDTDGCDEVELLEESNLRIDKSLQMVDPETGMATYLVTVGNLAEAADGVVTTARDVVVTDLPGAGLENLTLDSPSKGEIQDLVWSVGQLAAGESATVVATATVTADEYVNGVWVENPDHPRTLDDPLEAEPNDDLASDTDQADVVVSSGEGRLAIDKLTVHREGETVTFRVNVANLGGSVVENVVVTEFPTDLEDVVLADPSAGEIEDLSWKVGTLEPGQVESVTVTARVGSEGGVNRVFVEGDDHPHSGGFDPNESLETDTDQGDTEIVEPLASAELRLDKRLVSIEADAVMFDIEVCNVGEGPARETIVVDEGGLGVERTWSADARYADGTFDLGTLEPAACEVLRIGADMSGSGYNVAYVTSPDDPIDPEANQPNESIEEDTDGWDRVDTVLPTPEPAPPTPSDPGAGPVIPRLPNTGAGVGVLGLAGLVMLAGGLALRLRRDS